MNTRTQKPKNKIEKPITRPIHHTQLKQNVIIKIEPKIYKVNKKLPKSLDNLPDDLIPQRYKNNWFYKIIEDNTESINETIGQEILRLVAPGHPKTRLVAEDNGYLSVISKEIIGFKPFKNITKSELTDKITNGEYFGFGWVLVAALFLNEIDLHRKNIGVDRNGQVIKVDGGWCFAELKQLNNKDNYHISVDDINALPRLAHYSAANWLGLIAHKNVDKSRVFLETDFSSHELIRNEINQALLKIIITPYEILKKCVWDCIPESVINMMQVDEDENIDTIVNDRINVLIKRQNNLKQAASHNVSFQNYLLSNNAENDVKNYIHYLSNHVTQSKRGFDMTQFEKPIMQIFTKLQKSVQFLQNRKNTTSNPNLLFNAKRKHQVIESDENTWEENNRNKRAKRY